jgi:hypothetical protein
MLGFLLGILGELLEQLIGEALIEGLWHLLGRPFEEPGRAHPLLAAIALVLIGGVMGLILWLAYPARLFTSGRIPGASLVLSPMLAGLVMHYYGRWRESRGSEPSYTATFLGGALFAFGMALVRFLLIGRP